MCYFDCYRWECGDFRWGNFRKHCQSEYRMGETCGMKLIFETILTPSICPTFCEKIERKTRRYEKAKADYSRWYQDPNRRASAAKAWEDMAELSREISMITTERDTRRQQVGNSRRAAPQQSRVAYA